MLTKPIGHFAATDLAGGEIEHKALLGVDGGLDRPHDLERRRSGIPRVSVPSRSPRAVAPQVRDSLAKACGGIGTRVRIPLGPPPQIH